MFAITWTISAIQHKEYQIKNCELGGSQNNAWYVKRKQLNHASNVLATSLLGGWLGENVEYLKLKIKMELLN